MSLARKLRDWGIYLLAGLCVVFLAVLAAQHDVATDSRLFRAWIPLGLFTCFIFGYLVAVYKRLWGAWRFWLALGALLILHLLAYVVLLERTGGWPMAWFAVASTLELFVLFIAIDRLVGSRPHP